MATRADGVERRFSGRPDAIEIRESAGEGQPRRLTGLAAVYYDGTPATEYELDPGLRERIMPGCFAGALASGEDVICSVNHDWENVGALLGRTKAGTLRLTSEPAGLRYEVDLADTQAARDLAEQVRRRDISGSSFAFRPTDQRWKNGAGEGDRVREIHAVTLHDVAPVIWPAYQATTVQLRTLSACPVEPALEDGGRADRDRAAGRARVIEIEARASDEEMLQAMLAAMRQHSPRDWAALRAVVNWVWEDHHMDMADDSTRLAEMGKGRGMWMIELWRDPLTPMSIKLK